MKSLIVYCSSHGTTAKAAQMLRKQIEGEVVALNLNRTKLLCDVEIFDSVIIGGSIHAGRIQRKIRNFMKENHNVLLTKKLGLFLCCMNEGEIAKEQYENAFHARLRNVAIAEGVFGGEYLISKMNMLEKIIVKRVSGVTTEKSTLNITSINQFAHTFNSASKINLVKN